MVTHFGASPIGYLLPNWYWFGAMVDLRVRVEVVHQIRFIGDQSLEPIVRHPANPKAISQ